MKINKKKNYLSHIKYFFIMLLFVICLTMNAFFSSNYYLYELLDKTTEIETWAISENIVVNEDGDNTTYLWPSFLDKNNSYTETITKNICPVFMTVAIPKETVFFFILVFLFPFLTLFISLPDRWTLINQKVRLDN